VAAIWGLCVSIYVLWVAKGARKAAEEAKSAERLRSALEELQAAAEKCTQIGQHARAEKWDLVQLRSEEVMTCCRSTVARWGKEPGLKDSRNKLIQIATLMRSIAEESANNKRNPETILGAQLDSQEMISVIVGSIHKEHEARSR
jgi:hypothetical protein